MTTNDHDSALQDAKAPLPDMIAIDNRFGLVKLADHTAIAPDEGLDNYSAATTNDIQDALIDIYGTRIKYEQDNIDPVPPALQSARTQSTYLPAQRRCTGVNSLQSLLSRNEPTIVLHTAADAVIAKIAAFQDVDDLDKYSAFTISVRAALPERRDEATPVIMAELKQMLDKNVWHGVHTNSLTPSQLSAIIRSSMFLKDK